MGATDENCSGLEYICKMIGKKTISRPTHRGFTLVLWTGGLQFHDSPYGLLIAATSRPTIIGPSGDQSDWNISMIITMFHSQNTS